MSSLIADTQQRLHGTLERLLQIPEGDLPLALSHAADLAASALAADKVDAFLYDHARDSLVALGSSNQPLSIAQRQHGLDVLPISNGGRVVYVFTTGTTFATGRLLDDPEELRGVKTALKIQSKIGVVLEVAGKRRGVLMIASQRPDFFTQEDVRVAENVARWVGIVAHRAELIQEIKRNATEQGRRAVAEELVTVLAHDLRNYVSPIELRLNLLRRRAEQDGREADLRDLQLALRSLRRLSSMIADMLDVARVDHGLLQLDPRPVELVSLLEDIVTGLAGPEQPIELLAAEELVLVADPARVRQCIENVVSNAVQHSPKNAPVTVIASAQQQEKGKVAQVEIVDQGPGIPPAMQPIIFDRFVTGHAKDGGLGLGLHLAKQIAVLHGGDLQVDSTPGKGARFMLTLPVWEQIN